LLWVVCYGLSVNAGRAERLGVVGEAAGEADGFTLLGHGVAPWERLRSLSLED
jgi:hypothetical protein